MTLVLTLLWSHLSRTHRKATLPEFSYDIIDGGLQGDPDHPIIPKYLFSDMSSRIYYKIIK